MGRTNVCRGVEEAVERARTLTEGPSRRRAAAAAVAAAVAPSTAATAEVVGSDGSDGGEGVAAGELGSVLAAEQAAVAKRDEGLLSLEGL